NRLTRRERDEGADAIGAHSDFEPAVRPRELIAKIQRHGEQAIAYGGGVVGDGATGLRRPAGRVPQAELEIVATVGGTGAISQPPLIGKGRALGEDRQIQAGDQQAEGKYFQYSFGFHGEVLSTAIWRAKIFSSFSRRFSSDSFLRFNSAFSA